eukprot:m.93125 g.93125  ORF g.93125 m.93125 type:complete len:417 (-) comp12381_c0_seq3:593-1843(-)
MLRGFKDYEFDKRLGGGTYGQVFRAIKREESVGETTTTIASSHSRRLDILPHQQLTASVLVHESSTDDPTQEEHSSSSFSVNSLYAVKVVDLAKLNKKARDNLNMEVDVLKSITLDPHPFIVQMFETEVGDDYLFIVMEYCPDGDLSKYIQSREVLCESAARFFLGLLASALYYLRQRNIAHLDLKPSNLLLYKRGTTTFIKVADFGFACKISDDSFHESLRGTPLYLAPEMLRDNKYDARADLWSTGVILYEALFGEPPLQSSSYVELVKKVEAKADISIPKTTKLTHPCRSLLKRLLRKNPSKRISFEEFFHHEFVDLEHVPSESSLSSAMTLHERAKKMECSDVDEAYELHFGVLFGTRMSLLSVPILLIFSALLSSCSCCIYSSVCLLSFKMPQVTLLPHVNSKLILQKKRA